MKKGRARSYDCVRHPRTRIFAPGNFSILALLEALRKRINSQWANMLIRAENKQSISCSICRIPD